MRPWQGGHGRTVGGTRRAVLVGSPAAQILWRHVLPNVMPPIIIIFSITIGATIVAEASLSFLGFGLPPDVPSWGGMLSREGRQYMTIAPRLAIWPGLCLSMSCTASTCSATQSATCSTRGCAAAAAATEPPNGARRSRAARAESAPRSLVVCRQKNRRPGNQDTCGAAGAQPSCRRHTPYQADLHVDGKFSQIGPVRGDLPRSSAPMPNRKQRLQDRHLVARLEGRQPLTHCRLGNADVTRNA